MLTLLFELLSELERAHAIDGRRIYLTGQSLGGFGVCHAMARDADRFAAAVMVAGSMPEKAAHFRSTPTWIFVGAHDARRGQAVATHRAIVAAGGDAKLNVVPDVGHVVWPQAYATEGFWDWLFAQATPDP
jgi:predicted peptidase